MAGNHGKGGPAPLISDLMDIGVANPRIENLDYHISRSRFPAGKGKGSEWSLGGRGRIAKSIDHRNSFIFFSLLDLFLLSFCETPCLEDASERQGCLFSQPSWPKKSQEGFSDLNYHKKYT
jgi:hypothetical protein